VRLQGDLLNGSPAIKGRAGRLLCRVVIGRARCKRARNQYRKRVKEKEKEAPGRKIRREKGERTGARSVNDPLPLASGRLPPTVLWLDTTSDPNRIISHIEVISESSQTGTTPGEKIKNDAKGRPENPFRQFLDEQRR